MRLPVTTSTTPIKQRKNWSSGSHWPTEFDNWLDTVFEERMMRPLEWFNDIQKSIKRTANQWLPKVDIAETKKDYRIAVDVPNVKPEDVNVEITDHTLTISGKTASEQEEESKDKQWHRWEREIGEFYRTIELPATADADNASATLKRGTLRITIPKTKNIERKKITVSE